MDRSVTVVVISRDRRDDLLRSLPRHEAPVVLVDNGSTDGTAAAVRARLPGVRVIELARNAGAVARNLGVEAAETPYVAFADDDSWWAPGALARAADILTGHPRVGLLAGRVLVGDEERLDPVSAAMAAAPLGAHPEGAGPDVFGFLACGAIVRREAFLQVGGFDPVVHFPGEEERVALDLIEAGQLADVLPGRPGRQPPSVTAARTGRPARAPDHPEVAAHRLHAPALAGGAVPGGGRAARRRGRPLRRARRRTTAALRAAPSPSGVRPGRTPAAGAGHRADPGLTGSGADRQFRAEAVDGLRRAVATARPGGPSSDPWMLAPTCRDRRPPPTIPRVRPTRRPIR